MDDQELLRLEKTLPSITYGLAGMVLILIVVTTFLMMMQGFSAIMVMPIVLLPILFISFNSLNKVKKEVEIRKLKKKGGNPL